MTDNCTKAQDDERPEFEDFHPCEKRRKDAVGRFASAAAKSSKVDGRISGLVEQVSGTAVAQSLNDLVAFGTRWTKSPKIGEVTAWISDAFLQRGYSEEDVRYQVFDVPGAGPQRNVLCGAQPEHPGFVLVCAHYDSTSETPSTSAPGCDDNASGVAVLLETARVLRSAELRRGVLYAAFGGEEQNLYGSRRCAAIATRDQWKIDVVINLDMVGYRDPARPNNIIVEFDQGNRNPENDAAARAFGLQMAQNAADYTELDVEHTDIWSSDYMPFERSGYACVGLYDGAADAPFYHKTTDTIAAIDVGRVSEVTRLVVATVASIAL